jgi:hypothetical protein
MNRNHHYIGKDDLPSHRQAVATGLCVLLLLLLSCWRSAAAETRPPARTHSWGEAALGFGAGIVSAYALHEGGHGAAAGLTGTDLKWESGTYNQPLGFTENADNDTDGAILHGAGLATQAICGEVILAMDTIDKTSPYVRGIMFWNVANPVIYAFDYWFLHRSNRIDAEGYQGDLAGIEHYAGKDVANTFAAASLGVALLQGYRFWNAQKRAPVPSRNGLAFGIAPTPQGGAMVTFQIPF